METKSLSNDVKYPVHIGEYFDFFLHYSMGFKKQNQLIYLYW